MRPEFWAHHVPAVLKSRNHKILNTWTQIAQFPAPPFSNHRGGAPLSTDSLDTISQRPSISQWPFPQHATSSSKFVHLDTSVVASLRSPFRRAVLINTSTSRLADCRSGFTARLLVTSILSEYRALPPSDPTLTTPSLLFVFLRHQTRLISWGVLCWVFIDVCDRRCRRWRLIKDLFCSDDSGSSLRLWCDVFVLIFLCSRFDPLLPRSRIRMHSIVDTREFSICEWIFSSTIDKFFASWSWLAYYPWLKYCTGRPCGQVSVGTMSWLERRAIAMNLSTQFLVLVESSCGIKPLGTQVINISAYLGGTIRQGWWRHGNIQSCHHKDWGSCRGQLVGAWCWRAIPTIGLVPPFVWRGSKDVGWEDQIECFNPCLTIIVYKFLVGESYWQSLFFLQAFPRCRFGMRNQIFGFHSMGVNFPSYAPSLTSQYAFSVFKWQNEHNGDNGMWRLECMLGSSKRIHHRRLLRYWTQSCTNLPADKESHTMHAVSNTKLLQRPMQQTTRQPYDHNLLSSLSEAAPSAICRRQCLGCVGHDPASVSS